VLFPHGVLFRQEEAEMRRKLIESDLLECVLGLGPNLFYNSPMEACIVVCRATKPEPRKNKVLFINAIQEVTRENAQSFLTPTHQDRIVSVYRGFNDEPGFAAVVDAKQILAREANLTIPLYVRNVRRELETGATIGEAWDSFDQDGPTFWSQMDDLIDFLQEVSEPSRD
jgi:type I restriction enzyme M protein